MKAVCALVCLTLAHGITGSIFKQQERRVDGLGVQQLDIEKYQQPQRDQWDGQKQRDQTLQSQKHSNKYQSQNQRDQQPQRKEHQVYNEQESQQSQYGQHPAPQYGQHQASQKQHQGSQYGQQASQYQRQGSYYGEHQAPQNQQHQGSLYQQNQDSQYQQNQGSQYQQNQPSRYQTHLAYERLASSLTPEEWISIYGHPKHPSHQHNHKRRHEKAYHQASSQSESSQESQERSQQQNKESQKWNSDSFDTVMDKDNQKWNSDLFDTVMNKDSPNWNSDLFDTAMNKDNQRWNSDVFDTVINKYNQPQAYGDVIVWNGLQMAVGPNSPVKTQEDIEKIFGDAQKAMRHIQEEEKVKFHEAYEHAKQENNEDVQLNATQLAQKHQYPIEEHTIKTDDGYVLTVFRIPAKTQTRDVQKRPVVFLMHGILGSADDWLVMGPGKSLAYLLSDAGYDVWLGNARGNKYSRHHVSKHPAMSDFWHFSTDDIALHDLPAMIDYALETTKQEKLYYIGHAQGSTVFFGLTATRPEYNDKIIMMYALSPMVYMTNVRSPLFRMIAPTSKFQQRLQNEFGNGEFTPSKELIHTVGGNLCENEVGCKRICSNLDFVMAGVNVDGIDFNIIPAVLEHVPAGTSTKVIYHYGQGVASQEFQRFDYGSQVNEQVYGQPMPPKYNISEVQAPVTLYYSEEDWLAHPTDVERLQNELPNVRETYKVPEEHFSHLDFQFSTKAPELVYQRLIDSMQNNQ